MQGIHSQRVIARKLHYNHLQ